MTEEDKQNYIKLLDHGKDMCDFEDFIDDCLEENIGNQEADFYLDEDDSTNLVEAELSSLNNPLPSIQLNGDEKVYIDSEGSVRRIDLRRDTAFGGITYKGGTILTLRASGAVWVGTLAYDQLYHEVKYQGNTLIGYHEDGGVSYGTLAENTTFERANNLFEMQKGKKVNLDYEGSIVIGYLADTLRLTAPYNTNFIVNKGRITFWPGGLIQSCVSFSAHAFAYAGQQYKTAKNTRIEFWRPRESLGYSIRRAYFLPRTRFGIYEIYSGNRVTFLPGKNLENPGVISSLYTYSDVAIQNMYSSTVYHKARSRITFWKNGRIRFLKCGRSINFYGYHIPENSHLAIAEMTNAFVFVPVVEVTINGRKYPARTRISVDELGRVTEIRRP